MSTGTPPNWPIHGVSLSQHQISEVVQRVFPQGRLESCEELEKGKSFNNRIYFLCVKGANEDDQDQHAVLKVIGRFFDAHKVQNEVASLLMMAKYCPEIPAPRVLAWSEDGIKITAICQGVFAVLSDPTIDNATAPDEPRPWIMLSKCAGRVLTNDDIAGADARAIADQLADFVKSWRQGVPHRHDLGNIRLQPAGYTSVHDLYGLESVVADLINCATQPAHPLHSLQQYYDHLFGDQVHTIETNDIFAYLRPRLLENLTAFRNDVLPKLSCFEDENLLSPKHVSVFTHQDFAPRNILVTPTESGLIVTGVLDFEFSGFFAPEEEFLTSLVRQDSDWPKSFANILLEKFELRGIHTPLRQRDRHHVDSLFQLIKLIEHIAPWWLLAGHITGKDLELQLDEACEVIEANVKKLSASVQDSQPSA